MRALPHIRPTPEQLPLIQDTRPGTSIIRGAAGSGKTTTALLRLRQLAATWLARRERLELDDPVRILVITYNRTLRGYISELASQQIGHLPNLDLTVSTFSRWARTMLPNTRLVSDDARRSTLRSFSAPLPIPDDFLADEVDYLLGRFPPESLGDYVTCERTGRGSVPRVDRQLRRRILDEVVTPYSEWKNSLGVCDWNDLATTVLASSSLPTYDVVIADEVQDLSANQVRALLHVIADPSSVTFVLDAAQRIYPRGFAWREVGLSIRPSDIHRLANNYRNTVEICRFASPLLRGLDIGDDGTFPDFNSCVRHGSPPIVLKGKYRGQAEYAMRYLRNIDLNAESVAFLHPLGGGWFSTLRSCLNSHGFPFVELTRQTDWPDGPENIALSTMHSGKGLEFDHILVLGLNSEVTRHGSDLNDSGRDNYRRLLAMAITRARRSVVVGYKPSEASQLVVYFEPGTFQEVVV